MEALAQRENTEGREPSTSDKMKLARKTRARKETLALADPLRLYLLEIAGYGLLSREEEIRLAVRVREENDEEAAHKLVVSNLRLVVKIAMDFQRYWTKNVLDLIQEGNMGLIRAVKKFDPYRGIKFSYYASFWIKAYILKFVMENWKLVKIGTTQNQRKLFFKLAKERDTLLMQGLKPEPRLLAERLDVKEEEVVEMTERLGNWEVSINEPLSEGSREAYGDLLPDPGAGVDEKIAEEQRRRLFLTEVKKFRRRLSGRDADIFDHRIVAEDPKTLQRLGDEYHVSRERIRQIQGRIIKNFKIFLRKEIPNFDEDYADMAN